MQQMVTELATIRRLAEERAEENHQFRAFLKFELTWSDAKLDALVWKIEREVAAEIDCTACAECCSSLMIVVLPKDIPRLAARLGLSAQEFIERHTVRDDGDICLRRMPCMFLKDKLCSVYADRPTACRDYPHLRKREFRFRLLQVLENVACCPVAFNTFERLKERLWGEEKDGGTV